jgi:hypothetical protein
MAFSGVLRSCSPGAGSVHSQAALPPEVAVPPVVAVAPLVAVAPVVAVAVSVVGGDRRPVRSISSAVAR